MIARLGMVAGLLVLMLFGAMACERTVTVVVTPQPEPTVGVTPAPSGDTTMEEWAGEIFVDSCMGGDLWTRDWCECVWDALIDEYGADQVLDEVENDTYDLYEWYRVAEAVCGYVPLGPD